MSALDATLRRVKRGPLKLGCLIATAALAATACSDDDSAPGGGTTATTTGGGGNGNAGGGTSSGCAGFPEGAQPFGVPGATHCYWLVPTPTPQIAANEACGEGNHLATIGSADENAHVVQVAGEAIPFWIGFRCDANPHASCTFEPSQYAWMNGEPVTYLNWAAGEPSEARGAAVTASGTWVGLDALNNPLPYVCESGPAG